MGINVVLFVISFLSIVNLEKVNTNENIFVSPQNNVFYIESEQKFTWYDALSKCAAMNMSLATIDTKIKSQEVTSLLSNILGKRTPLWIGGCITGTNPRQFVWIATGKKFIYTNWAMGQPDFAGNNEYCAQIGWTNIMEWNDHVCSNQFGFICEYSRLHDCEAKLQIKVDEESKKVQQTEVKQMVGEILHNCRNSGDVESRAFRDLVFNINQNAK